MRDMAYTLAINNGEGLEMQVTNSTVINGQVVGKLESHKGVVIYQDENDVMYICKDGVVIYTLEVDAYSGEGGGGSIGVTKVNK